MHYYIKKGFENTDIQYEHTPCHISTVCKSKVRLSLRICRTIMIIDVLFHECANPALME